MDISYLHGRQVVSVTESDPAAWVIELEGGGYIYCYDETHEAPVLDGLAFTTSSVTDDEARLYFGTNINPTGTMIVFRASDYGYSDDVYSGGEVERADAVQEATGSPEMAPEPDPRVAEGPSEEWLAARKAQEEAESDGA